MRIIHKSIHIIDYEKNSVMQREAPLEFDSYITELIGHVSQASSFKAYKSRSCSTEVLSCVLEMCSDYDTNETVISKTEIIANRLLLKEADAQAQIARTNTNVKKGSLVQVLLKNDVQKEYSYILAKVEHSEWIDDYDFTFKTGFSKEKKAFWKSCLIQIPNLSSSEFSSKVHTISGAKYWSDAFLEFDEVNTDAMNTRLAFKAIDAVLNQSFKGTASPDRTVIRNTFIGYLKNNELVNYSTMVDSVLENYQPYDASHEKINSIRLKLHEAPEKKGFDGQFTAMNKAINARIKQVYPVTDGVELKINQAINQLSNTIQSFEVDGVKYIRIRTTDENTYKAFQIERKEQV